LPPYPTSPWVVMPFVEEIILGEIPIEALIQQGYHLNQKLKPMV